MRLLSNLHVKGKPAVLPDRAIRRRSHYFIYRPCMWSKIFSCVIFDLGDLSRYPFFFCRPDEEVMT